MEIFSSSVFWGLVVVLIGLSIVFKQVFHFSIPVIRILIGLFFIWLGLKIMFGIRFTNTAGNVIFSESSQKFNSATKEYSVAFGNGLFDFSDIVVGSENVQVEVNSVFGNAEITVNSLTPVEFRMTAAFGQTESPDNSVNGFGENKWFTPGCDTNTPRLIIKGSAVFGKLELRRK